MVAVVGPEAIDGRHGRVPGRRTRARSSSARSSRATATMGRATSRAALDGRPVSGRIAVAVSGTGSNLRALHAAARRGELGGEIVLVVADRPCPALDWAAEQGIDAALVPGGADDAVLDALAGARPDVVALAGYLRIVGPAVLAAFAGRILNTHPSLLPAFPGAHAVRDALAHGVKVTGATVHLVDATLDGGPIVAQEAVPILAGDDEASLHERIKAVEHRLLPRAVALLLAGAGRGARAGPAGSVAIDVDIAERRLARPAPGAPVRLGQDRAHRARARTGRCGLRARLHRWHRADPARGRPAGHGRRRGHRRAGDARRAGEDAPPADPRRHPRRPPARRASPPARRRRDRPVRARRREPLPVRGRRRATRDHVR